jgi:hypothetical protein
MNPSGKIETAFCKKGTVVWATSVDFEQLVAELDSVLDAEQKKKLCRVLLK